MTLPLSGPISLNAVNVELSLTGTTLISLGQASVRTLAGVASGAIALSNLYGKSNRTPINVTISSSTQNYVANTAKAPGYVAGLSDVIFTINAGVVIGSDNPGFYAFFVDTSWSAGDTVRVVNNGTIVGAGGAAGSGANAAPNNGATTYGGTGGDGGPAVLVQRATTWVNNGTVGGGGGGGGGGAAGSWYFAGLPLFGVPAAWVPAAGSGGGGGSGNNSGSGGFGGAAGYTTALGSTDGNAGTGGSTNSGGSGGAGNIPSGGIFVNNSVYFVGGAGGNGGALGNSGSYGGNAVFVWSGSGSGPANNTGFGGAGGAPGNCLNGAFWVNGGAGITGGITNGAQY